MNGISRNIINKMNRLGKSGKPFIFLVDFEQACPLVFSSEEANATLLWSSPESGNVKAVDPGKKILQWNVMPISYDEYKKGFDLIMKHIRHGDSYLLNYTRPTLVRTNLNPEEIFYLSRAKYKVYLKDRFVCFSPEIFVRIKNGKIFSFPMKGTIDASIPDAEAKLKNDRKEMAEHHTIVDLIRNDLSTVAYDIQVDRFRYIDRIKTNRGELLQMSSRVSGTLPPDYREKIGSILSRLLPAGSVSGAPKARTVEIIKEAEGYNRGYYTGVFACFDGQNLDSCVLIRYLENQEGQLVYKSGGGITHLSDCRSEYEEMINKVYVPVA